MSINKAEQSLNDKLVNDIEEIKQQLIALKTHLQPIGADMLDIRVGSTVTISAVTVTAGGALNVTFTIHPTSDLVLTLYNFEITVFVDTYDDAHKYPDGSSLIAAQRNIKFESWLDWEDSIDNATFLFIKAYKMRVVNNDTASHNYYIKWTPIFPKFSAV